MALTFQEIKNSYENSEKHIHVTKLPVAVTFEKNEFSLLHVDNMWPHSDKEYAQFDIAYVAKLNEEIATGTADITSKGFFISMPGADDYISLNNMGDSEETSRVTDIFGNYLRARFFTKDGNLIVSALRTVSILKLLKFNLCYECHVNRYDICEYSNLAFNRSNLYVAYSKEKKRNIHVYADFVVTPVQTSDDTDHSYVCYIIDDCEKLYGPSGEEIYALKEFVHLCSDCGKKYVCLESYKSKCYHCHCVTEDTHEVMLKADAYYENRNNKYYKEKPVTKICPCCGHEFIEPGHIYMRDTVHITICNNCNDRLDKGINYKDQYHSGIFGIISGYHSNNTQQHFYGLSEDQDTKDFKGFGFELEVDKSDIDGNYKSLYNNLVANAIIDNTGLDKDEVYFETDSSLDNGFEIISQPHTIASFYEKIDSWKSMLDILSDATFKSHNAGTCGLHIHVSKAWFGSSERQQNFQIGKIYKFFDAYWTDLLKASRRDTGSTNYCGKNGDDVKCREEYRKHKTESHAWQAQAKYDHDTRHNSNSHHYALNNSNYGTFEIRLGRGTLNKASFFAWIDLVLTIVKNSSKGCNKLISARDWLEGIKPSTAMYLLKRRSFTDAIKILHNDVYELYNNHTDSQD